MNITPMMVWAFSLAGGISLLLLALLGSRRWAAPVVLAAAYITGHIALDGWPGTAPAEGASMMDQLAALWPTEAKHWAILIALMTAPIGLLVSGRDVSNGPASFARILLAFAVVNVTLMPLFKGDWEKVYALMVVQGCVVILMVIGWSLDALAEQVRGPSAPLVMALTAFAAGLATILNYSQTVGMLGWVLACAMFGALLVALFRKDMDLSRGGVMVFTGILAVLVLTAVFFGDLPYWVALTIVLTPTLVWLVATPLSNGKPPLTAALLAGGVALLPLAIAVGPSLMKFIQEQQTAAGS